MKFDVRARMESHLEERFEEIIQKLLKAFKQICDAIDVAATKTRFLQKSTFDLFYK